MSIYDLGKKVESLTKSDEEKDQRTPREEAADSTNNMIPTEYTNARDSSVPNIGEDIAKSARHAAIEWKGLNAAESDGSAENLINLKNLKKLEPVNLTNYEPGQDLAAIAAHYCVDSLPNAPKLDMGRGWGDLPDDHVAFHEHEDTKGNSYVIHPSRSMDRVPTKTYTVGDLKKMARSQYLENYRFVSAKAEEVLKDKSLKDPNEVIKAIMSGAKDRYRSATEKNSLMGHHVNAYLGNGFRKFINLHNSAKKNSAYDKTRSFMEAYKSTYGSDDYDGMPDQLSTHVNDIVSAGKTLKRSFDLATKTKNKSLNRGDLYTGEIALSGSRYKGKDIEQHINHLTNEVGLRAIQYGNSVTDKEREHHTRMVAHSMSDLTDVLDIPPQMGSFNGKLGVAIGARGKGKALAHYEPSLKVINMTRKNGVGTLAHEWGHFFDHIIANVVHDHDGYGSNYHSLGTVKMQMAKAEPSQAKDIHHAYSGIMDNLNGIVRNRMVKDYHDRHPDMVNVKNLSKYWLTGHEMFARALEKHLEHKLQSKGKENTYLSSSPDHALWPNLIETKTLEPLFDKLFDVFKKSEYLKKSLDHLDKAYQKGGRWFPESKDQGVARPDNQDQEGHVDKTGNAVWAQASHVRDNQGQQLMRNFSKLKMSPAGKESLRTLITHTIKDPDHASMNSGSSTGSTGDYSDLRLRHIHKAVAGHSGYSIQDHGDGGLTISAERHSTNKNNPWKSTTWHFDGKKTLKSIKKDPIRNKTSEGEFTHGQENLRKERSDGELDQGAVGGVRRRVRRGDSGSRHGRTVSDHGGTSKVLRGKEVIPGSQVRGKNSSIHSLRKAFEMIGGSIDAAEKSDDPLEKAVPEGHIVIYADGDNAGSLVEKAVMSDEIDKVKDISSRIGMIGNILEQGVKALGGEVFVKGGDDFAAILPADFSIEKLQSIREKVRKTTGFSVTIGVGDTSPKAIHALLYGKMNGKDQIAVWSQEMTDYIKKHAKAKSPEEKAAEILGAG